MGEPDDEAVRRANARWADLRKQVVFRSKRLSSGHLIEADQRYGTRHALGPHAVMLFFTTPVPTEPQGYRLHTAWRLFLSAPESDDLPRMLADLTRIAATNIAHTAATGHRWHPLGPERSMVNGGDMAIGPDAAYVGVGVSTLDSDDGRWYQLARTLREPSATGHRRSAFDLKGRCYLLLTDGTAIDIDRNPHAPLHYDGIRSSKPLDADRPTHWHNPHATLTEQGDHTTREVWRHLTALHHTLTGHLDRGPAT
ncbi:hypothetical protein [Micromonospora craniellae]|uniref:hypothetical protein n=1 Tax=Micromonospora craniellae TaxID=2294034 RepID=UPI001CC375CF|nr:hypothetical protein [Micromonospora craniellae]